MILNQPISALALAAAISSSVAPYPIAPAIIIQEREMPQFVPEGLWQDRAETDEATALQNAVAIYHDLRNDFAISHTEMSKWLGIKRRTLYNWMKSPESSTRYGAQIEKRLSVLRELRDEIEPEHRAFLYKIAFSPIYGNPKLGIAILEGASSSDLTAWYDELFSQFESYRLAIVGNEQTR